MPWFGLRCVIVVYPDHTHFLSDFYAFGIAKADGDNSLSMARLQELWLLEMIGFHWHIVCDRPEPVCETITRGITVSDHSLSAASYQDVSQSETKDCP